MGCDVESEKYRAGCATYFTSFLSSRFHLSFYLFSLTLAGEANKLFRKFGVPPFERNDLTSKRPCPTAAPCQWVEFSKRAISEEST